MFLMCNFQFLKIEKRNCLHSYEKKIVLFLIMVFATITRHLKPLLMFLQFLIVYESSEDTYLGRVNYLFFREKS